ncbi:reverse transcriptase domain-containing protein [Pseudoscourfieldia marina]
MVAFDLQDGYYALEIAPEHQQYFTIEVDQQAYRVTGLPMGWNASPWVFTQFTKVITRHLRTFGAEQFPRKQTIKLQNRQRGMLLLHYLDDYLILGDTPEQVAAHLRYALSLLSRLGIAVNEKKSTLTPVGG